ncbi:histidine--tRNA ligase [Flavihumibacter rivuli]|uniref:histidine--tRNA ligase n=1 Tax=Flavihumibacter rivuli TaxID=2838156 RepID=UPI001BDF4122|nr:histidine--tRNA ligase [Flavihumibacter rivuli]ULQ58362.1 histidine--tRNA ligase [Flavihumibacter rivuli]
MSKVSLPQGTRDFGPEVVRKRNYIFSTIKTVFELYGFQPLETPAMENLDTLMGKYGEEGDKLIFKILNNGLGDPKNIEKARNAFEQVLQGKNDKNLTERALRYDLTIPFARYVAMNHGQLTLPFKRYQVQPVWRADRPQKGRYREFYQCDADVVGSQSLINEVELTSIYAEVFRRLGITVEIRINNRKILAALAEVCGGADKMTDITIAIDKLDKIGMEKVKEELAQRGLTTEQIAIIEQYLNVDGSNAEKLGQVKELLGASSIGQKGIEEISYILERTPNLSNVVCDFTLARGLNYYTGIIFEIKALNVQMGSIGGGGRYDDLTGLFGVPNVPGVGISFGVDRIYDVMEELNLFPAAVHSGTKVLFFNLGEAECLAAFGLMQQLRANGIACEIYHEQAKFDKQFKYADKKQIPFAVIIGGTELAEGKCVVKNLKQGEQQSIAQKDLANFNFQ